MDKGNAVVVLDKNDYYDKLNKIIDDDLRFSQFEYDLETNNIKECSKAPWIIKEKQVQYQCKKHIKAIVDQFTYTKLYPTGSQPGKLYGTAKNHKKDCPLRPVLAAIGTAEYNLAKWLEQKIKPYLNNKFSTSSSSTFINELLQIKPSNSDICVGFDIKSLYTNVPLKEVIDDILYTIYSKEAKSTFFKDNNIKKCVLKHMLQICSESQVLCC